MKIKRSCCWLLLWDKSRVEYKNGMDYLADFPLFVGTLPSRMSCKTVGEILRPLVVAYVAQPVAFKVALARPGRRRVILRDGSTISGQLPRVSLSKDHPHDVECTLGRIFLRARLVGDLLVVMNGDGSETLSRIEYLKLFNNIDASFQAQIETPDANWRSLPKAPPLDTMLAQLRGINGTRLNYLYFIYRIGSFDTHGNSLNALFEAAFGKSCNFPFLQIAPVVELIADQYLHIIVPLIQHTTPGP